ncbi:MAG: hypothetical protein KDD45_18470, partial [Bdellovibrionales bacterium]|nr:hypothetical protein [Bdellovibrionales bacterium]
MKSVPLGNLVFSPRLFYIQRKDFDERYLGKVVAHSGLLQQRVAAYYEQKPPRQVCQRQLQLYQVQVPYEIQTSTSQNSLEILQFPIGR